MISGKDKNNKNRVSQKAKDAAEKEKETWEITFALKRNESLGCNLVVFTQQALVAG